MGVLPETFYLNFYMYRIYLRQFTWELSISTWDFNFYLRHLPGISQVTCSGTFSQVISQTFTTILTFSQVNAPRYFFSGILNYGYLGKCTWGYAKKYLRNVHSLSPGNLLRYIFFYMRKIYKKFTHGKVTWALLPEKILSCNLLMYFFIHKITWGGYLRHQFPCDEV